jgi:hypothetical protein
MKKGLIFCFILMLLCVSFSGCNEKTNVNTFKKRLIGDWSGASIFQNVSNNITITFYEDNTAEQVDDFSHAHWFTYEINEKCLILMLPDLPPEFAICYEYEFTKNYNSLTLSNETLDTIILTKN